MSPVRNECGSSLNSERIGDQIEDLEKKNDGLQLESASGSEGESHSHSPSPNIRGPSPNMCGVKIKPKRSM